MQKALKVLLGIVFIPLFLIFIILITTKFYILNSNFLLSVYNEDFYKKGVEIVKTQESELDIDPIFLKDFADRNIVKIIDFLNGNNPKLLVYIPKGLGFTFAGDEVPLESLLSKYTQMDEVTIQKINYLENLSFYLSLAIGVIIALMLLMFWFAKKTSGVYLIIAGVFTFLISRVVYFIKNQWIIDLIPKNEGIAIIGVPLMDRISAIWLQFSILTIILGILIALILIKRPGKK